MPGVPDGRISYADTTLILQMISCSTPPWDSAWPTLVKPFEVW